MGFNVSIADRTLRDIDTVVDRNTARIEGTECSGKSCGIDDLCKFSPFALCLDLVDLVFDGGKPEENLSEDNEQCGYYQDDIPFCRNEIRYRHQYDRRERQFRHISEDILKLRQNVTEQDRYHDDDQYAQYLRVCE